MTATAGSVSLGAAGQPVGSGIVAALASAGLFLAHYRMAAVLALLLAVWLLLAPLLSAAVGDVPHQRGATLARWRLAALAAALARAWAAWRAMLLPALAVGGLTALLLLPWLVRLAGGLALGLGERPGDYGAGYYALERLGGAPTLPGSLLLLALAAAGLYWALRQRAMVPLLLAVWAAAQLALANPYWWPMAPPLAGRVDFVSAVASLGFPLAVLAAGPLAALLRWGWRRRPRATVGAAAGAGLAAAMLGCWQLGALVTPDNALVAPADLAAAAWLRASTPPEARVAATAVLFPWAPDYAVGVDAGYWLPLLAGRATTVLPMLYPAERGADPTATRAMVAVARALRDAPAAPETAALLRAQGVTHLYHGGRPGTPPVEPLLANSAFELVYARDSVWVLAVRAP